jgi:signal transduction histidine kinase
MDNTLDLSHTCCKAGRSDSRLLAQYAVTLALAEAPTLKEAVPAILRGIGESLDYQLTMFWQVDERAGLLRLIDLWHGSKIDASKVVDNSRQGAVHRQGELIERVWKLGKPFWASDILAETDSLRSPMAARIGLHAWVAFPIRKGTRVHGVIECFSHEISEPDHEVLHMVADIGIKVGQFIERKEIEAELRRVEVADQERERLTEVARVLGDIAHDIKNMLMPVVSGATLLEEELNESHLRLTQPVPGAVTHSRELTGELIQMIQNGSRRIQDRLAEFADSIKGHARSPHFAPCQLAEVVSSVYAILRIPAEECGITLYTDGLHTLPPLRADESLLFNAFYNLVNNAIPEVPPGGSVTIKGRLEEGGKKILVSVTDTGKGMTPEVQESLFTYQAISRKVGGTGLGTKIVKDVVVAHRGLISVESELGLGSSFHITLPLDGMVQAG